MATRRWNGHRRAGGSPAGTFLHSRGVTAKWRERENGRVFWLSLILPWRDAESLCKAGGPLALRGLLGYFSSVGGSLNSMFFGRSGSATSGAFSLGLNLGVSSPSRAWMAFAKSMRWLSANVSSN